MDVSTKIMQDLIALADESRIKTQNHLFDLYKAQGYKVKETPIKIKDRCYGSHLC